MKVSPIFFSGFDSFYLGVHLSMKFTCNLTFLTGLSCIGKTFLWKVLDDEKVLDSRIVTYDYKSCHVDILKELKKHRGSFIVIDNADILLDDDTRFYIATDNKNQYLIIGRNPKYLLLTKENYVTVDFSNDVFSLRPMF